MLLLEPKNLTKKITKKTRFTLEGKAPRTYPAENRGCSTGNNDVSCGCSNDLCHVAPAASVQKKMKNFE